MGDNSPTAQKRSPLFADTPTFFASPPLPQLRPRQFHPGIRNNFAPGANGGPITHSPEAGGIICGHGNPLRPRPPPRSLGVSDFAGHYAVTLVLGCEKNIELLPEHFSFL